MKPLALASLLLLSAAVTLPVSAQQAAASLVKVVDGNPAPAPKEKPVPLSATYKLEFEIGAEKDTARVSFATSTARFTISSESPTFRVEGELVELEDKRIVLRYSTGFTVSSDSSFVSKSGGPRSDLNASVVLANGRKLELFRSEKRTLSVTATRID